jgi:hypothetical protein
VGHNSGGYGYILPADVLQSHRVQVIESSDGGLHQEILGTDELGSDVVAHDFNSVSGIVVSNGHCPIAMLSLDILVLLTQ